MTDLSSRRTVVLLSGQVEEEVSRPAEELVDDAVNQHSNWRILSQLSKLNHVLLGLGAKLGIEPRLAAVRDERGVLVHVSGGLVVLAMAQSPGVERDQEEGVHDQSHGPIELLVLGKGPVATLMCQNPDTGKDEPGDRGVCSPGKSSQRGGWDHGDVGCGSIDEHGVVEKVAHHICH